MNHVRVLLAVLLAFGLCLGAVGCGGGGITLKGNVTLDGQPLPDAELVFAPKDAVDIGAANGRTDAEGNFEIDAPAMKPGTFVIRVEKYVDKDGKVPALEAGAEEGVDFEQLKMSGELRNILPPNSKEVEIQPGTNEGITIALTGGKK